MPLPVERASNRPETVQSVRERFLHRCCVAIYGSSGKGKTQLAILTAKSFTGRRVWIPLRRRANEADAIITGALRALIAQPSAGTRRDLYRGCCSSLATDSVIVLDDLPASGGHEMFAEALIDLCSACNECSVRLLTTSARRLPWRTRDALGVFLDEAPAPPFTDSEVQDLFCSYGAPEKFLQSGWLKFSQGAARQHPGLLVEAARYLQAHDWSITGDVFDDLLLGRFARALDTRTIEDVQRTVPDRATRDLLYRLRLIGAPFVSDQVDEVSAVPPKISSPMERLVDLLGLWIQQDSTSEYVLCPLVASIDENNLSSELRQNVHRTIASGIMGRIRRKQAFGPEEASQAVVHFTAASQFDEAAMVLVLALHGMMQQKISADHFSISSIWVGMPLPEAINHETKIHIRL